MPSRSSLAALVFPAGVVAATVALFAACSSSKSAPGGSDASTDVAVVDGGVTEAEHDAGIGLTCAKLLQCDQPCSSNACTDACYAESTAHAQGLFNAMDDCINENCSSADGGPCASASSSACSQCNQSAATGPCINDLVACESDTTVGPPDPDGGAEQIDSGPGADAGPEISCGALVGCQQACAQGDTACQTTCSQEGTSTAQALDEALVNCVAGACPATDGGACSSQGTTCSGCEEQADYGTCGTQFSACQDDKSSTDGGTEPVALHGGTVKLLVPGLSQPQVVLIQNGQAYFSEVISAGPILKVPITGGADSTLASSQPYPMGLSIDANNIYVWNSGSFSGSSSLNNSDGTVVQVPLNGSSATTLATGMVVAFNAPYLNAVTNDVSKVYFVTGGPGTAGSINVVPIGGGSAAQVLYANQSFPQAVVTDGTNLYWGNWGTFDAQGNYNNDGTIMKAPIGGGSTPQTLASNQSAPAAIAIDGQNVYWTNIGKLSAGGLPAPNTGSVMQVANSGSGTPITLAGNQDVPLGITVSGTTVYWAEFTLSAPGNIISAPVGGGSTTTLVANVTDPFGIAVSGGAIYWTDNIPNGAGSGSLWSLTP
ncbi:MAG TPA: hypothetical protein VGG39_31540 [Polyangiaceae bacterium]|jgi:hypothetical protein